MCKKIINSIQNLLFDKKEIISLLRSDKTDYLFNVAKETKAKYTDFKVHLRGIIEISNCCNQNCLYCGIRKDNNSVKRYKMPVEEIIKTTSNAAKSGFKTIVLQGGLKSGHTIKELEFLCREIKKLDIALTLSLGELSFEELKRLKNAGAERYLLKMETSDEKLYSKLKPGRNLSERLECHRILKKLGFQVGSGIMVGLPNQTIENLADDVILLCSNNYDMLGIGPFIPHKNTPLFSDTIDTTDIVLKLIAISRIALKNSHIPVTSALLLLNKFKILKKALDCGGNVIMANLTPKPYYDNYEIYPGRNKSFNDIKSIYNHYKNIIENTGYKLSTDYGHR